MAHWYSFGRPKERAPSNSSNTTPPLKLDSCASSSLVRSDSKYAYIDCGFAHDTYWHGEDHAAECGVAVVKFHLHTKHKTQKRLNRVECNLAFSQPSGTRFRSVWRCWPSSLRGVSNSKGVSNTMGVNPSIGGFGVDLSVGEISHGTTKSLQSNWTVTTQQRLSQGQAGAYDMVAVVWEASNTNDHVTWSDRKLYAAAVLECAKGDLIVTSSLQAFKKSRHGSGGSRSFTKYLDISAVQFVMTPDMTKKDLEVICTEVEKWTQEENSKAIQTLE